VSSAKVIALFLDFDGTLVRLRPRPEMVWMDGSVRDVLANLVRKPRFRVHIISGRRRGDVRARSGVAGIQYLGLHGWEGRVDLLHEGTRRGLRAISSALGARLVDMNGAWIEDKRFALTVHYSDPAAREIVEQIVAPQSARFRLQDGHKVWEILPREIEDKGAAVRHLLRRMDRRAVPIYLGDDEVDEAAFVALTNGITVRVGCGFRSHARYRLAGVAEVRQFLQRLARV